MALKLSCVFDQPSLSSKLIKLVEIKANKLNAAKKNASVQSVYNELRDKGFEIDAESVAFAYMNAPKLKNRVGFSTTSQINKFGGAAIKNAIKIANEGTIKNAKLGKQTVSQSVATGLATTFQSLSNNNDVNKSRLFELQEVMKKYVNSQLNKKAVTAKIPKSNSVFDNLKLLLDVEDVEATSKEAMKGTVVGNAKAIEDMWAEMQKGVNQIALGIKDKAKRAEFETMVSAIRSSSYKLMLTNKNANDVVLNVVKKLGFTKQVNQTIAGNTKKIDIIDWNKVLASDKIKEQTWEATFATEIINEGFTEEQANIIVKNISANFDAIKVKAMDNRLKQISNKKNLGIKINKLALQKLVELKNAGVFSIGKEANLREAMGVGIPNEIATEISEILDAYEDGVGISKGTSPLELEMANRAIRNLMQGLNETKIEKLISAYKDYQSLRSGSIIATTFNGVQNVTSGMGAAFNSSFSTIARTKNLKLVARFARIAFQSFADVSYGGVQLRNNQTITTVDQLQGAGSLSDRWTLQNAKNLPQYVKAITNILSQVTSTAFDAANKAIIADAAMINATKMSLIAKGKTEKQANQFIDNMLFGKSNVEKWKAKAKEVLAKYPPELRGSNYFEARLSDSLFYNELVDSGLFTIQNVIDIHSTSTIQAQINLGQSADSMVVSSVTAALEKVGSEIIEAKRNEDDGSLVKLQLKHTVLAFINMYVSGKINWLILQMQNSYGGAIYTGGSLLIDYAMAKSKGKLPLYAQNLDFENSNNLQLQLQSRAKLTARLERNIVGGSVQLALGLLVKAIFYGESEDEKREDIIKKMFNDYMNDPVAKRFLDKLLPMSMASELSGAYNKKTGEIDTKKLSSSWLFDDKFNINKLTNVAEQLMNQDSLDRLNKSLAYASKIKDEDEKSKATSEIIATFVGSFFGLPYVTQYGIVSQEFEFIKSGFKPNEQREIDKKNKMEEMKEDIDGGIDAAIASFLGYDLYKTLLK